jgi:peroxiredoxin
MSLTPSTMLPLGSKAPDFQLWEPGGTRRSLDDFRDVPALLVMFICNHCPYVKHVRLELAKLARDYQTRGLAIVAINSNDAVSYPEDGPERMARQKIEFGYTFPYLYDKDQEVAKAYEAACTPDFYLFDAAWSLVYRGQLDGSRPGNAVPVDGRDLRKALDLVLANQPIPPEQQPSLGCNIKWRPGNEPDYAR